MKYFKFLIILLLFFGLCISFCFAQNINSLFDQANQSYKEAQYEKAIELYEEIIKEGKESGPVYYNLGNAYFKDGQLGKSIVSYERARQLMPRDSDLKFNYQYVVSFIKNNPESPEIFFFKRLFNKYADFFTLDELSKAIFSFYFLVLMMVLLGAYLKKKNLKFLSFVFVFILIIHIYAFMEKEQAQKNSAIVIQKTEAKFEPMETATTHFNLSDGVKLKILEEEGFWYKIERVDGKKGWAPKAALERI